MLYIASLRAMISGRTNHDVAIPAFDLVELAREVQLPGNVSQAAFCGIHHTSMPIAFEAFSVDDYISWILTNRGFVTKAFSYAF